MEKIEIRHLVVALLCCIALIMLSVKGELNTFQNVILGFIFICILFLCDIACHLNEILMTLKKVLDKQKD